MKRTFLASMLLGTALSTSAHAADWTGFSFGAEVSTSTYGDHIVESEVWEITLGLSAPSGGVRAAYDFSVGNFILGVVGSYTTPGTVSKEGDQEYLGEPDPDYLMAVDIGGRTAIGLRAGMPMGNSLPYVLAGVSQTDVSHRIYDEESDVNFTRYDSNVAGQFFGGGVDFQFGNGWVYGIEVTQDTSQNMFMPTSEDVDGYGGDQNAVLTNTTVSLHIMKRF